MIGTIALPRRGRPPTVHETADNVFAVTVKDLTLRFRKQTNGTLRRVDRTPNVHEAEVRYARRVIARGL